MASVFVTVGTTKFEELVQAVTDEKFQKLLISKGYSRLVIQLGSGIFEPDVNVPGLTLEWYRLKDTLAPDMKEAALIISHGGSGCIFESLNLGKSLVVVINENLMNNHQTELASQLAKDGYLVFTTCKSLYETVKELDPSTLIKYQSGNPKLFGDFLDKLMGFEQQQQ